MGRTAAHLFWIVLLLSVAGETRADTCGIVNGSFEDGGYVSDIVAKKPTGWSVEMPAKGFWGGTFTEFVQPTGRTTSPGSMMMTKWSRPDASTSPTWRCLQGIGAAVRSNSNNQARIILIERGRP